MTRTVVIWPVSTWNMLSLNFKMKATDKPSAARENTEDYEFFKCILEIDK